MKAKVEETLAFLLETTMNLFMLSKSLGDANGINGKIWININSKVITHSPTFLHTHLLI